MASLGSRRNFTYTSDSGLEYIIQADESIYETLSLGMDQAASTDALSNERFLKLSSKRPLTPRYIQCVQQDGDTPGRNQRFFVGKNDVSLWVSGKIVVVDGVTYAVTAKIGEQRFLVPSVDTGLLDGDVDVNIAAAGGV